MTKDDLERIDWMVAHSYVGIWPLQDGKWLAFEDSDDGVRVFTTDAESARAAVDIAMRAAAALAAEEPTDG